MGEGLCERAGSAWFPESGVIMVTSRFLAGCADQRVDQEAGRRRVRTWVGTWVRD
ncbi:hypothetical protein GCM10017771_16150 [Streptomyces capitiformicae]|uniref:Uncharacterized protein n=1 Tax=Streptomyces capitiformicae TaxID=2014920 RepID=A0A919GJ79_9ACTN|nr:hypothetical protein GCM10017771_16150 [Streptomyces capitiformicae]